ncbi:MAG: tetratricopeptide repeat protein [Methyloglobulus sp.]|nr:tetratricopeptide repeat protein [Methyloglobulus sp.]
MLFQITNHPTRWSVKRCARNLLLLNLLGFLDACDYSQTQRSHYIEEGKRLYQTGDIEKAKRVFDKAVAVEPANITAHLQIAEEISKLGDMQTVIGHYQAIANQDSKQLNARIKLANIMMVSGKLPDAEKWAKEALALAADNEEVNVLMGGILSAQNNTDAAIVIAERLLKKNPEDVSAILLMASLTAKTGDSAKAISLLLQSIAKQPNNVGLRLLLVDVYMQTNAITKANDMLMAVIELEPKQLSHRLRLAKLHLAARQIDKAEDVLRTASENLPDNEQAKMQLAEFLVANRSPEVALAELIPMVEETPDAYELRFKLADLQMAQHNSAEVEDILTEVIEQTQPSPHAVTARNKLAQFYLTQNRVEDAKKLVKTNLVEYPDNTDALIIKAKLALADNNIAEAINRLRAILAKQPGNKRALNLLSNAHKQNNDSILALENLQKILESSPQDEDVRINAIDLLLKTGQLKQAEEQLDVLFKLNPNSKNGLETLAKIYLVQKQWEQTRQIAKDIQIRFAGDASGFYMEGLSYQAEGKFEKSLEPLIIALRIKPQAAEPLSQLIAAYLVLKQPEKAISKLKETIKTQPENFFAYNLSGSVYRKINKLGEAVNAYHKAIEIKPGWSEPYRNLALIQQMQKKSDEAITTLTRGINSSNSNDELVDDLAQIHHRHGEYDKVIALYEKIHQNRPDSLIAINNLVSYTTAYGKEDGQLVRAGQLLNPLLQSENSFLIDTAAWFLYRQGQYEQARDALLKAETLNSNYRISQYQLGMAYFKIGDKILAKQYLQKSVNGKIEFNGFKEAKETLKLCG